MSCILLFLSMLHWLVISGGVNPTTEPWPSVAISITSSNHSISIIIAHWLREREIWTQTTICITFPILFHNHPRSSMTIHILISLAHWQLLSDRHPRPAFSTCSRVSAISRVPCSAPWQRICTANRRNLLSIPDYVASRSHIAQRLGIRGNAASWRRLLQSAGAWRWTRDLSATEWDTHNVWNK